MDTRRDAKSLGIRLWRKSWKNILLLWDIDENVEYSRLFAQGHGTHAALIAFSGSGIGSVSLFVLGYFLLKNNSIKQLPYLYYFIFWFQLMNLGNFYDYVPIRTFSTHGDMGQHDAWITYFRMVGFCHLWIYGGLFNLAIFYPYNDFDVYCFRD